LAGSIQKETELMITIAGNRHPGDILRFSSVFPTAVGGSGKDPLQKYADRVLHLSRKIEEFGPDLLISDLDPAAVRTAFGLGIPCWSVYSNGSALTSHMEKRMSYPLCEKVFASSFFNSKKLEGEGIPSDRIVEFEGFNECYLKSIDHSEATHPRILIRPNGHNSPNWAEEVTKGIIETISSASITVLGLKQKFRRNLEQLSEQVRVLDFIPYPPVIKHDLFVGWGRMLGESFVMGLPSIRTAREDHPDLSIVYSQQPILYEPEEITEASREMIVKQPDRGRASKLENPVSVITEHLREQEMVV
jgi:predicted glycosyltransferase